MNQVHWSCEVVSWMRIDWLDLPKLTTLRTNSEYSYTFRNPRHITLESDSHSLWMTFRHVQSHQCVSSICILLQEWRHNPRKYSLHPSLTNRHRSSSRLFQQATSRASKWRLLLRPFFCFSEPLPRHINPRSSLRHHVWLREWLGRKQIMRIGISNLQNPIRIVETT